MTFKEIVEEIPLLSDAERKQLMLILAQMALKENTETPRKRRIAGLHAGTSWVSDDFDEPLPDEFWLGEE